MHGERIAQRVLPELGLASRAGMAPHVRDGFEPVASEQIQKRVQRPRGMAYRPDRRSVLTLTSACPLDARRTRSFQFTLVKPAASARVEQGG
jgi:hypothetical protein